MDSSELITFSNPTLGTFRGFIDEKGEPWFLAAQVCRCLGIKNAPDAINELQKKMKSLENYYNSVDIDSNYIYKCRQVSIKNGNFGIQKATVIPEQWLYELIFSSKKQVAIAFRAWVTGEVLPSLRKHGEYRMQGKLIRRSLTDTIKSEIVEKPNLDGIKYNPYAQFSVLVNESLGLPRKVDRSSLSDEMLERIARREDMVRTLVNEGKNYKEIEK